MTNKREPIADDVRRQLESIDISVVGSLAMGYKIVAQLRGQEPTAKADGFPAGGS